jgi:hypothetical protein
MDECKNANQKCERSCSNYKNKNDFYNCLSVCDGEVAQCETMCPMKR